MNHLTPNDKCSMCEACERPVQIVCSMKFSLNWNPLNGLMQSHLLNYTSVIKFKCTDTEGLLFAHMEHFEWARHNRSTQLIRFIQQRKNKNLFWRLSTLAVVAEREMHAKQTNQRVVILSPHSINSQSEKYDYYFMRRPWNIRKSKWSGFECCLSLSKIRWIERLVAWFEAKWNRECKTRLFFFLRKTTENCVCFLFGFEWLSRFWWRTSQSPWV